MQVICLYPRHILQNIAEIYFFIQIWAISRIQYSEIPLPPIQLMLKYKFMHVHQAYYMRLDEHSTPQKIYGTSHTNFFHIVCTVAPNMLILADCSVFRDLPVRKGRVARTYPHSATERIMFYQRFISYRAGS